MINQELTYWVALAHTPTINGKPLFPYSSANQNKTESFVAEEPSSYHKKSSPEEKSIQLSLSF